VVKIIWKRKWIIIPAAVAIILAAGALGAVAVAAGPQDLGSPVIAGQVVAAASNTVQAGPAWGAGRMQRWQDRLELWKDRMGRWSDRMQFWKDRLQRCQDRLEQVRDRMSAEDKAALDKLLQTAKDQRTALQKAQEDLRGTLQQIRSLLEKYLDKADAAGAVSS
jgi:hypothetical protein